jgi:hypothetical protein
MDPGHRGHRVDRAGCRCRIGLGEAGQSREGRADDEGHDLIARHQGGFGSLPRYNGNAFVPSNEIVGSIESVSAHTQKLVTRTLKPGGYLLVTSKTKLGGDLPILAGAAVAFSVR